MIRLCSSKWSEMLQLWEGKYANGVPYSATAPASVHSELPERRPRNKLMRTEKERIKNAPSCSC